MNDHEDFKKKELMPLILATFDVVATSTGSFCSSLIAKRVVGLNRSEIVSTPALDSLSLIESESAELES